MEPEDLKPEAAPQGPWPFQVDYREGVDPEPTSDEEREVLRLWPLLGVGYLHVWGSPTQWTFGDYDILLESGPTREVAASRCLERVRAHLRRELAGCESNITYCLSEARRMIAAMNESQGELEAIRAALGITEPMDTAP